MMRGTRTENAIKLMDFYQFSNARRLRQTRSIQKCKKSICFCVCVAKCKVCMMTRGCASAMICNDNAHKHDTHNLPYTPARSQCACGTRTRRYAHRCPSATLHPRPMNTDSTATAHTNQNHQYLSGTVALVGSMNCALRASAVTSVFIERGDAWRCCIGNRSVWMPPGNTSPAPSSTSVAHRKAMTCRPRMGMYT